MTKSSTRKAAARTARPTHPKKAPRITRATYQQTTKVLAEKSHVQRRKIASKGVVEQAGTGPGPATQFDEFRDNQTMSVLAESGVIQTREVYERSKHALQAVLESWQMSFGAAGRGVSRRMINVAGRNITATLDLATGLAGAKNLADAMASYSNYWRRIINLDAQAEEARAASTTQTSSRRTERR
jgi:hypothetical protein